MREILFRGKRKEADHKWVEGFYAKPEREHYIIFPISEFLVYWHEVDPVTIGQYTGLKDKNGQRIFEGDIVHMKGGCVSGFGVVEFRNGSFGIADAKRKRFYFLDDHSVYRVDGNIHDNGELIHEK